jgi:hypothetical protein
LYFRVSHGSSKVVLKSSVMGGAWLGSPFMGETMAALAKPTCSIVIFSDRRRSACSIKVRTLIEFEVQLSLDFQASHCLEETPLAASKKLGCGFELKLYPVDSSSVTSVRENFGLSQLVPQSFYGLTRIKGC